ncbi:Conserved hypothethical protein (Putative Glyoxalase/Bleomycin resistance protein/Dihydroxybiphenyl dioxygenase) [Neorhizobium galegae bv. officinalis]|jgi:PhnB protein|uniref:Conserved hypothethical protein (Putative Glyoxalase/Bleomycin resistance protein/Dihydroxybiphenyl dioxygenase) n=1 Tax=Neorhizobium galegae bv. officinalis TaxID=323656 RepID=A0A0T7FHU9_NEOGA|nr:MULTISPECIES: glyoxalase/bleomycin resistance/extradiol dioxygenase family protein [Neorhizobium]CDZ34605.1 Conserved hypothethical protein (Putative Glyoxalase/Bleomycin resistance protein/Dihydroxybiphenyl dioxygenase) [Neorhizobium galegae bv. officinalis]
MDTNAQTNDKQAQSPVRGGVVAYLQLDGAMKAAEYYKKALGATIESFHPVDDQGRTMHIHLYINGSSVMLCDPYPDYGHPLEKPQAFTMMLPVDDIDFWWKRAVDAGMTVETELQVMFWGDRYGQVRDPFGVAWAMNAPVKG